MRQIYNSESPPEFAIRICETDGASAQDVDLQQKNFEETPLESNNNCKNPSRLSLANLLPSRSDFYFIIFHKMYSIYIITKVYNFLCCQAL